VTHSNHGCHGRRPADAFDLLLELVAVGLLMVVVALHADEAFGFPKALVLFLYNVDVV
jgi:hypothetical protein